MEERRLLASLIVTGAQDNVDPQDGFVSLREAILEANSLAGPDEITIDSSVNQITLQLGELSISDDVTIKSAGQALTIDGDQQSRVINIDDGNIESVIDVTLIDLTITGGKTTSNGSAHSGGGIRFSTLGTLTLQRTTISNNSTEGQSASGGGLYSRHGNIDLIDSVVRGNQTTGISGDGGGIGARVGAITITGSTISDNHAEGGGADGGGVSLFEGSLSISQSTVDGNTAVASGGGGVRVFRGDLLLNQVTISNNVSRSAGGGVTLRSGDLTLNNSTVQGNSTTGDSADGGGIHTGAGQTSISNSTISGNFTLGGHAHGGGISHYSGTLNLSNTVVSGNKTYGARTDGGGIRNVQGTVTLVDSEVSDNEMLSDDSRGAGIMTGTGSLTLTNSIVSGNANSSGGINLGGGIFTDTGQVTLYSSEVTGNRVWNVGGGIATFKGNVTLHQSTVANNRTVGVRFSHGGGIGSAPLGDAIVRLYDSSVIGNRTIGEQSYGGGLSVAGPLTVSRSTIANNVTQGEQSDGGGIFSFDHHTVALVDSTISGNEVLGSRADGGGIYQQSGELRVIRTTITGNKVEQGVGGGIALRTSSIGPDLFIQNSIVAGNRAFVEAHDFLAQGFSKNLELSYSLIGNASGTRLDPVLPGDPGFVGNLIGSEGVPLDPLLGPLADNGGATWTHAVMNGSPVIDSGIPRLSGDPEFDQRGAGFSRFIDGDDDDTIRIDMGSFEYRPTHFDFGDAPIQYPVALADDGARHVISPLFLGQSVDHESDGLASEAADADGSDEDGVIVLADLLAVQGIATTASFDVTSSAGGKLDAWIDFNSDGDWLDDGEQIATELTMEAGNNTLSYNVPVDAVSGATYARFRLSSDGGHAPSGEASSGEVEDYVVNILDALDDPELNVRLNSHTAVVGIDDDQFSVTSTVGDLLTIPISSAGALTVTAGEEDEILFDQPADWRMGATSIVQGRLVHSVTNVIRDFSFFAQVPHRWQNIVQAGDVNNSGDVTAGDALLIINELGQRVYSDPQSSQLMDPLDVVQWPDRYFDQNGDDKATALDALRVINLLSETPSEDPDGEGPFLVSSLPIQPHTYSAEHRLGAFVEGPRKYRIEPFFGGHRDVPQSLRSIIYQTQQTEGSRPDFAKAVDVLFEDLAELGSALRVDGLV